MPDDNIIHDKTLITDKARNKPYPPIKKEKAPEK